MKSGSFIKICPAIPNTHTRCDTVLCRTCGEVRALKEVFRIRGGRQRLVATPNPRGSPSQFFPPRRAVLDLSKVPEFRAQRRFVKILEFCTQFDAVLRFHRLLNRNNVSSEF